MKRTLSTFVAALLLAIGLSACGPADGLVSGTTVNLGQIGVINSINSDVAGARDGEKNAEELANLTTSKFFELDANGQLVANPLLGTIEVLSSNPLRVKYTLAKGAAWSDGEDIDAADMALSFAAGAATAGVNFYSTRKTTGLAFATLAEKPSVGDDSITLAFSSPVADYRTAITLPVAAHTVAQQIDAGLNVQDAKKSILEAITSADLSQLSAIAEVYRSAFNTWAGLRDESLFVSSGPYRVEKSSGNKSLSLLANVNFNLGPAPKIERIVLTYVIDSATAIASMSEGNIDATETADSGLVTLADILGLVGQIKGQNINQSIRTGATAEQIVFNFKPQSRFSTERNGGDATKALTLRKAFLNLVPRSRIVSGLSTAYKVSIVDSLVFQSTANYYRASVQDNGLSEYLFQDIEKAGELAASTGIDLPMKVRVAYDMSNPRSAAEWILLRERAASAGFNLKAVAAADFEAALTSGNFEVFIGARPIVSLPSENLFSLTTGSFVGYKNQAVQAALSEFSAAKDEQGRGAALKEIDAQLVADAYGMPLYEVASLVLFTDRIEGFAVAPMADSVTWGYQNWSIKPKS